MARLAARPFSLAGSDLSLLRTTKRRRLARRDLLQLRDAALRRPQLPLQLVDLCSLLCDNLKCFVQRHAIHNAR